jgi:uncharacterized protein DUF1353
MTRVLTPLVLQYIDGDDWLITQRFSIWSDVLGGQLDIEGGTITDFNSSPQPLWPLIPPTEFGEAAVAHDELYKKGRCNGQPITREQADNVHQEFVAWVATQPKRTPAPAWKRAAFHRGLRLFGWVTWRRYRAAGVTA